MFSATAYALGAPGGGGGGGAAGGLISFAPLIVIFAIFYFLLIRPQQRKQANQRKMLDQLNKGQKVITQGGIYGTVVRVKDDVVTVQIAEQVRIELSKSSISSLRGDS